MENHPAPTPSVPQKPRIRRTHERGVFEISSRTRPGLTHKVDVVHLECSCEAGRNGIRCWHLAYALQAERVYQTVDAQHGRKTPLLQPVPAPSAGARSIAGGGLPPDGGLPRPGRMLRLKTAMAGR